MNQRLQDAMWAGDMDTLQELAPCRCCCHEHTHDYCPARHWNGCRSGLSYGESRYENDRSWQEHYAKFHNMSEAEFYGYET